MKKSVSLKTMSLTFAVLLCFTSVCGCMSASSAEAHTPTPTASADVAAFSEELDSYKSAVDVSGGGAAGMRVHINGDFTGVGMIIPTYTTTTSGCTLSLYKWSGDYTQTTASAPVASSALTNVRDCALYWLTFSPQTAGEYMLTVTDAVGKIAVWVYPSAASLGFGYINGAEQACDMGMYVRFVDAVSVPFIQCVSSESTPITPSPEEYTEPEYDILRVRDAMPDTWVATDGLGRVLSANGETGDVDETKVVGLFYWSWHDQLGAGVNPVNTTEFMKLHPDAKNNYYHSAWPSGANKFFWNEPVYGYYRTSDRWVIRRHAELLANAGVDVIFFDNTNGTYTWKSSYDVIFEVFDEARRDGVNTPDIAFMLPFAATNDAATQLRMLYSDIYSQSRYQNLWFYWEGKPMIMAYPDSLSSTDVDEQIKSFFTFRPGQPVYAGSSSTIGTWGWLSIFPQQTYRASRYDTKIEQMTVSVAQNWSAETGLCAMNGSGTVFGRSYTSTFYHTEEGASKYGYNFAEQAEYALRVDPTFVFITGWNEWVCDRHTEWLGTANAFPDTFTDEYSRDIEPSKGELKDHYYYQMTDFIRRFKGTRKTPEASVMKTINIDEAPSQWDTVSPNYIAYQNNTANRSAVGYGYIYYSDTSGRNDFVSAKVARDLSYVYFMAECAADITSYTGADWMRLYIDTGNGELDGWESFDYVINKEAAAQSTLKLQRFTGNGYETEDVADVRYTVSGRYIQIAVPKACLGIVGSDFALSFKWTDNVPCTGDIMDFYTYGDVAPGGRFKYLYESTGVSLTIKDGSDYMYDAESCVITDIAPGTTVETFLSSIVQSCTVYDKDGAVQSGTDIVGTGGTVCLYEGDTRVCEAVLIVPGDATGDGVINGKDILRAKKISASADADPNSLAFRGADMDKGGTVNTEDITLMLRHIRSSSALR